MQAHRILDLFAEALINVSEYLNAAAASFDPTEELKICHKQINDLHGELELYKEFVGYVEGLADSEKLEPDNIKAAINIFGVSHDRQ